MWYGVAWVGSEHQTTTGRGDMAAKKAGKKVGKKAAAVTKKAVKGAAHEVAKGAKKLAKEATLEVPSPEKERSQPPVGAGTIGAAARDDAGVARLGAAGRHAHHGDGHAGRRHRQHARGSAPAGPTLLEDFHLREKIMHFDHERIPERVVHARGAGAHGRFELTESLEDITCAGVLTDTSVETRRCSCASRPSPAHAVRPTPLATCAASRRSSTRSEGNFDLVGNNIPVFFIQDGIKFPDLIHAAKPEPDREIPQAQTAHDTFWDFVSLTPESTHMLMWAMSDRAIPRSFRTMEGFGVHTFRLVQRRRARPAW